MIKVFVDKTFVAGNLKGIEIKDHHYLTITKQSLPKVSKEIADDIANKRVYGTMYDSSKYIINRVVYEEA